MEPDFSYLAAALTTEELTERIDNRKNYLPETVEAAVAELKFRKHAFTDAELTTINADIDQQRKDAASVDSRRGFFNRNAKKVIVKDPEAPSLYSRQAIYGFTVLCGALFGSILLAINVGKTKRPGNAIWIVVFGVVFTALQIYISEVFVPKSSSSYAILWGLISAAIIDAFFWKQFIGYATFYRARPIWVPLIIAVVIFGLFIALIIIGGQAR
jgi:hypothetical protein